MEEENRNAWSKYFAKKELIIINVLNQSLKDIYLKRKNEILIKIYERQEAEIEGGLWQDFDLGSLDKLGELYSFLS